MAAKKDTAPKTAAPAADKKAALETALAQIEKQFGKGAVMKLGANVTMQVDAIPTGSLGLDLALGIGGVPRGRIVEVYGPGARALVGDPLAAHAERVEHSGDTVFFYTHNARALLQALQAHPQLRTLHRPANLEDLFLKLTGRQIREDG